MNDGCETVAAAKREKQVTSELAVLSREVGRTGEAMTELLNALDGVLTCAPPPCGGDSPDEESVPLATSIRRERRAVAGIATALEDALSRLEI